MSNSNLPESTGPSPLDNIRIVLVGTLYAGNVGSVCRAMANMGLRNLILAGPRLTDNWSEARRMAVHATDILDARRETGDLSEAIADCTWVVGTTARGGLYRSHAQEPREATPSILSQALRGPVALVFGREDKGLANEEIAQCNELLRIPVDERYASLNLSQAVLICAYELFTARGTYETPYPELSPPATADQRARLMRFWREAMLTIDFMDEQKADHMMQGFQRLFSRGIQTDADLSMLLGVARQAQWAARATPEAIRLKIADRKVRLARGTAGAKSKAEMVPSNHGKGVNLSEPEQSTSGSKR
ncbi:MAG: RNA methyltransferase [Kiritimatiellia bacterium]|nr:RNA methyltransferase [Kiritimatiellia bacterium]